MDKRRISTALAVRVVNPVVRWAVRHGLAPRSYAVLETTGRRSGEPRRTPVGHFVEGGAVWIVAEHGARAELRPQHPREPARPHQAARRLARRDGAGPRRRRSAGAPAPDGAAAQRARRAPDGHGPADRPHRSRPLTRGVRARRGGGRRRPPPGSRAGPARAPSPPAGSRARAPRRPGRPPRAPTAWAARPARRGAERERRDDVEPAPDPAVDPDLAAAAHRCGDLLEDVDGGRDPVERRAPWFETTIASAPCSTARRASSARRIPFSTSGRRGRPAPERLQVVPGEPRGHAARHDREAPVLAGDVERALVGLDRCVAPLALAVAEDGRVDRDHERAVARRRRALDQLAAAAGIALQVELEPARRAGRGGRDVLDRVRRERGEHHRHARGRGGAHGAALPVGVQLGVPGRGGDRHRHRGRPPEERRRRRHLATSTSTRGRSVLRRQAASFSARLSSSHAPPAP